jgi:hypothetical protein
MSTTQLASEQILRLSTQFDKHYATLTGEKDLGAACRAFTIFWKDKILSNGVATLNEVLDFDPIIRIFDISAKRRYRYNSSVERNQLRDTLTRAGLQYGLTYTIEDDPVERCLTVAKSFQVARTMLPQTIWYEMFRDLKVDHELASKLGQIFNELDVGTRASLIDGLRELNSKHRNMLTTTQAVGINAFLFLNSPTNCSSVVSLAHRRQIIEAFKLGDISDEWSYGQQVVFSNELLKVFNSKFGADFGLRKLSSFFYWEPVQVLWKKGRPAASVVTQGPDLDETPLGLNGNMPRFHVLEEPEKRELGEIAQLVETGQLAIPLFQRDFVWTTKDIADLFESILRGYFIGSILLWTVNGEPDLQIDPIHGTGLSQSDLRPRYLILDGQQRISSVYYATNAPNLPLWNTTRPYVFFIDLKKLLMFEELTESSNLVVHLARATAERRGLMSHEGQFSRWYFPIFEFKDYNEWLDDFEAFLRARVDSEQHEQLWQLKKRLRDYLKQVWERFEVPMIKLPQDMSLADVAKIFEKLNSTGIVLTVFDLLNARMVKHQIMLRHMWDEIRASGTFPLIRAFSEDNDRFPVHVLQTLALIRDKQTKSEELLKLSPDGFQSDWNRACIAVERALKKAASMRDGFGVISSKWLPYSPMIPMLAFLLDRIETRTDKPACISKVNMWYWCSIMTHAYSGSTDAQLTQDSKQMLEWFDNETKIPETVLEAKDELKKLNLKRMTKTSDAVYKAAMCLVALRGGRDFRNVSMLEFNTLDDHHIFPQSKAGEFQAGDLINSIANRTLIDKDTNEKYIRNSRPSDYLTKIMKEQSISEDDMRKRLESHLISHAAYDYMLRNDFDGFLAEREKTIAQEFGKLIGEEEPWQQTLITPNHPFSNKMIFRTVLHLCDGYIDWADKYLSREGLELLTESLDKNDVKRIRLITASEKADEALRKSFADFRREMKNYGIESELHVITDPKLKSEIHDRWIITENACYNVPSPDIVARGQFSEIKETRNRPPFEDWWSRSYDIIEFWNRIQTALTKTT